MGWIRFLAYFLAVALVTWGITQLELASPGGLRLHVIVSDTDIYGTSEFSPVEIIQAIMLVLCGGVMAWVGRYCASQRPLAIPFGGLALAFLIRELDYFLDRYFIDNLWQSLIAVVAALVIVYAYRNKKRIRIALARIWPSPGLTLLFSGAVILFAYGPLVGHEPLWQSIIGEHYLRVTKLAIEEFIELSGYFLWMIGTVEYALQARAIAYREPQPAARRRREKRRHDAERSY
jgi:cbb3-type cytochrome oxidase subunit 3